MKYIRNCPECDVELTTMNKYWHKKASAENKKCGSCSLKGRTFSEEHRKNLSKNHANVMGNNNPFHGKKHTEISIKKMLDTRNKHPNWKQNSSNAMRRVRDMYWGNDNPMNYPKYINKIRIKRILEIENNKGQVIPNYNPSSIPIIEQKAKELGIIDLQHAENGGEFYIKELGYWVDGYSKEKNTVIEYYEKHHNRTKKRDKRRKEEIISYLNCEFIIIYE